MAFCRKASLAAIIAFLSVLATAASDDKITTAEWINAALAFFLALAGVWIVPNKPPTKGGSTASGDDV